ncbi:multicystatin-like [Canna indica]|uniref:Multicystatin-like n=1 Tax=Canna indica TaxID=4628 RepID=A0AAQ3JLY7_9LILI|nr:multicystatin-like [Canna indica]
MRDLLPHTLLLLLFTAFVSTSHALSTDPTAAAAPSPTVLGGWNPIKDVNDPHIRDIAVFAINEYNKQESKNLALIRVEHGEQQVVAGMNYRLTLLVNDGRSTAKYEAIVFESLPPKSSKKLTSFRPLLYAGGWTPVSDINDPHIHEVAEFAVSEQNKKQKSQLSLTQIVSGKTQVVAGINYRLVLVATDEHGKSGMYVATVWEKSWENFMQLTSFYKPPKN